jgi:cellulose synthase/poly-beta-1,6-N-acetylglucosamine synthase-like glycosyltransferase
LVNSVIGGMKQPDGRRPSIVGELIIPGIMAAFIVAYWWQAASLSVEARAFPAALTAVLVALLAAQLLRLLQAWHAVAVLLLLFWREIGGTLVIFGFILAALLILKERRLWLLLLLPGVFSVVLAYLFKVVLRVRFPDGIFGLF